MNEATRNEDERMKIEASLNGYYLCTSDQHKTCKSLIASIREIAKHRPLKIAGRGKVEIKPDDIIRAYRIKA